jgi:multidrug efflux pump subunit AcrA (membrane-fusion protein)
MRFLRRSLTGLLLVAATLGLLGLAVLLVASALRGGETGASGDRPAEERAYAAPVVLVEPGRVVPVLTGYGKVEARLSLDLRATGGGRVVWVSEGFREGLAVAEGDLLARLDATGASEALALAEADLAEAGAAAAEATATLDLAEEDLAAALAQADLRRQALTRQQDLAGRGAGSPQAVETAELAASAADQGVLSRKQALATARARIDQSAIAVTRAEIALGEAQRVLDETDLRAGQSGRIAEAGLAVGSILAGNEVYGRIIDPVALEVALRLSTDQALRLVDAEGALLRADVLVHPGAGKGPSVKGRLDRLGAAVAEGQVGRLVYLTLGPEAGVVLQPGDFVTVEIAEPPLETAMTLPAVALGGNGTVLVLGPEDRLEEQAVALLRRQGDEIIIDASLIAGREVVTERSAVLGAGIRVRPIRAADQATMALTEERRTALATLVKARADLSEDEKARLLDALNAETVPVALVERLEARAGG